MRIIRKISIEYTKTEMRGESNISLQKKINQLNTKKSSKGMRDKKSHETYRGKKKENSSSLVVIAFFFFKLKYS